jgi:N-acetylglucosaminyldiphosphoundecaprenol N-acetyl-beta-D-mannosaminyltransferase
MNSYNPAGSTDLTAGLSKKIVEFPSFDLLGIRLNRMTAHDLVDVVEQAVDNKRRCVIGNHNLHSLYLWIHEPKMRGLFSIADYINIDGMSLVLLGRLFGCPFKPQHRTNYIDLLPLLTEEATRRGWKFFYLGSRPGVAEKAAERLRRRYPGLQIATRSGYFEAGRFTIENQSVLAEIRRYAPDVLLVGMGMPRQEIWISENLEDITAHTIFCCGGLMDLVAGEIPTAPRWLGPLGLEWLYRLCSEPTRLWKRYLLEPWFIFFHIVMHYLRNGQLGITIDSSVPDETEVSLLRDRRPEMPSFEFDGKR